MTFILVITPTLGRAAKMRPLAENACRTTESGSRVLFVIEAGDAASLDAMSGLAADGLAGYVVNDHARSYAGAVNAGYAAASGRGIPFTHFLTGADDLLFHPAWDVPALAVFESRPELGVVGTNDMHEPGCLAGKWASHVLVSRRYIDGVGGVIDQPPGTVLCEAYVHGGCLSEFHHTIWMRGVWAPCLDSLVEHCSTAHGLAGQDDTYRKNLNSLAPDTEVFKSRSHLWPGVMWPG